MLLRFISNIGSKENITICSPTQMSQDLYTAYKKGINIQLLPDTTRDFIVEYEGKTPHLFIVENVDSFVGE